MGTAMTVRRAGLVVLLASIGAALLLAIAAVPAQAFVTWAHDGIPPSYAPETCAWCHGESGVAPATNESCTQLCHRGFKVTPGATVDGRFPETCWSCHAPGADTSGLSSPSSACSQACHLYTPIYKSYDVPYSHGVEPHLGSEPPYGVCLDCHATSVSWNDPGASPHHDGVAYRAPSCVRCHNGVIAGAQQTHDGVDCEACHEGMNFPPVPATCNRCHPASTFGTGDCLSCHDGQVHNLDPDVGSCTSCHTEGYQKHAGKLQCTACHTNTPKFHHATAAPSVKTCRNCHAKKHAGKNVSGARCADCHKGSAPPTKPRAQHSSSITKKFVCSGCHGKKLHAKAAGASTTCRSCHKGKYHAAQPSVFNSACLTCHPTARGHSGGRSCVLCHKSVVHDPTP